MTKKHNKLRRRVFFLCVPRLCVTNTEHEESPPWYLPTPFHSQHVNSRFSHHHGKLVLFHGWKLRKATISVEVLVCCGLQFRTPPAKLIYDPVKRNTAQDLEGWISGPSAATIFHDYQAIPGGIIKHLILPHLPVCLCCCHFYPPLWWVKIEVTYRRLYFLPNTETSMWHKIVNVSVIKTGSCLPLLLFLYF